MIGQLERLVRPSDVPTPAAAIPGAICSRCGCPCGHRRPDGCKACPRPRWWRRYSRG